MPGIGPCGCLCLTLGTLGATRCPVGKPSFSRACGLLLGALQSPRLSGCSSPFLLPNAGFSRGLARRLLLIAHELHVREVVTGHMSLSQTYFYRKRGKLEETVPQLRQGIHSFLLECLLRASMRSCQGCQGSRPHPTQVGGLGLLICQGERFAPVSLVLPRMN